MARRSGFVRMLIVAMLVAGTACQSTQGTTGASPGVSAGHATSSAQTNETFVYAYNLTPKGSWLLETDDGVYLANLGIAEPLTRIDFDGNLKPSLATQWAQTSPTTWEFTLRDGVKFQDGGAVDATAVAFALSNLLQAKTPARSFNTKTVKSVEAVGANKVRITTPDASPLLPLVVASPNTAILSKAAYKGSTIDPLNTGTGPFVMTKDNLPQSVSLKANPSYWGGAVSLKSVEVRFVPDANTRAALARSGEAQLVRTAAVASLPAIKSDPNLKVTIASVPRTTTLYVNNAKPPFNDVRVRQAIQSAIDVKALASDVLEGAVIPAVGPFAPTQPYAPTGAQAAPYDLEKAKSLLSQAGVDPTKLTLGLWAYPDRPEIPTVAVAIQAMLKKLGINVEVRVAAYNSLEADALAGKFDMFIVSRGYLSDINDPYNYLVADFGCKGGYQLAHFCNSAVDDALAKAATISDVSQRYAIYRDIAAQMQSQAVNVFLWHEVDIAVTSTRVQNYKTHPLNNYVLTPELSLIGK